MMGDSIYKNFISLGWYCGTAASMEKYGLRSSSGPFDWYFSELGGVMRHIETGFVDFLNRDNLEEDPGTKKFWDTKYNFIFPHEVKINLDYEYSLIYDKYQRRIQRFSNNIKNPTCFIRAVRDQEEVSYIKNNRDYINYVIHKDNAKNEIIYILLENFVDLPVDLHFYPLKMREWKGNNKEALTGLFDEQEDFLNFCRLHICEQTYKDNLKFLSYYKFRDKFLEIKSGDYDIKEVLQEVFSEIGEGILIFGAGDYGKESREMLQKNNISVAAYVDNDERKWNTVQDGIYILPPNKLKRGKKNILIAVKGCEEEIEKQLTDLDNDKLEWIALSDLMYRIDKNKKQ